MAKNAFDNFKEMVNGDVRLSDELKKKYLDAVDTLSQGKALTFEVSASLIGYVNDLYKEAEDNALASNDAAAVQEMADAHVEKDAIMNLIMGSGVGGIFEDAQPNVDAVLNKIAAAATA